MPRGPRVDAPGCVHHVMLRGVARRDIFLDDRDRVDLRERLCQILPETGTSCFAWAFMPNHVHLVLRTGRVPLARVMARLGTGYAQAFNRRHDRVGHLFQNRYRSVLVEDERQLRALVRYVHLNPLRAGIVGSIEELEHYPWTGHSALMGVGETSFQDTRVVLAWFAAGSAEARTRLTIWMRDEAGQEQLVFGPEDGGDGPRDRPLQAEGPQQPSVDDLIARVCESRGISRFEVLHERTRAASNARAEVAFRGCAELGLTGAAVGRALRISEPAVSLARARGRRLLGLDSDCPAGKN